VIYKNQLSYAVIGQEQDTDTIGNASYAVATNVGINSDPVNGGLQSEDVWYVAFKGAANVVPALDDVNAAAALAEKATSDLIVAGR
ncbi:MAG TPA: glycoside hydrolase family 75 protein, partial [Polyangiaceae bacterium]|nr:glycoside hydrolase family 75 protein [Polyangiaceae bacterium]